MKVATGTIVEGFIAVLCCAMLLLTLRAPAFATCPAPSRQIGMRERWLLSQQPQPLVVVAAGLPRSGSTLMFNLLRVMLRQRDPNTVSGYVTDLKRMGGGRGNSSLEAYRALNTTVLVKTHGPVDWERFTGGRSLASSADLTVLTRRDLRDEARSLIFMEQISHIRRPLRERPYAFEDPAHWVMVARTFVYARRATFKSVGRGRFVDVPYEKWNGETERLQIRWVRKLAKAMDWEFSEDEMRAALHETKRLRPPAYGAMPHPVTQLHGNHVTKPIHHPRIENAVKEGYKAIAKDTLCRMFLRRFRYL